MGKNIRSQYDLEDELLNLRILLLRTISDVWESDGNSNKILLSIFRNVDSKNIDISDLADNFTKVENSEGFSKLTADEKDFLEDLHGAIKSGKLPSPSYFNSSFQDSSSAESYFNKIKEQYNDLSVISNISSELISNRVRAGLNNCPEEIKHELVQFATDAYDNQKGMLINKQSREENIYSATRFVKKINDTFTKISEDYLKGKDAISPLEEKVYQEKTNLKEIQKTIKNTRIAIKESSDEEHKKDLKSELEKQKKSKDEAEIAFKEAKEDLSDAEEILESEIIEKRKCLKEIFEVFRDNGILRILLETLDVKNLKEYWEIEYKESMQFHDFGVQIIRPTARWNVYGDNQWTKPNSESLYISLPISGNLCNNDISTTTEILTKYYRQFPSFLGRDFNNRKKNNGKVFADPDKLSGTEIKVEKLEEYMKFNRDITLDINGLSHPYDMRDSSGNDYDLGISNDEFLSFSSMLIKLIPAIWNDKSLRYRLNYIQRVYEEFKDSIWKDCEKFFNEDGFRNVRELSYILGHLDAESSLKIENFSEEYNKELRAILKEHYDYESPWIFNVRFIYRPMDYFFSKDNSQETNRIDQEFKQAYDNVPNLTTIEIPFAPEVEQNANAFALALARYNATGPAYPFTCS